MLLNHCSRLGKCLNYKVKRAGCKIVYVCVPSLIKNAN